VENGGAEEENLSEIRRKYKSYCAGGTQLKKLLLLVPILAALVMAGAIVLGTGSNTQVAKASTATTVTGSPDPVNATLGQSGIVVSIKANPVPAGPVNAFHLKITWPAGLATATSFIKGADTIAANILSCPAAVITATSASLDCAGNDAGTTITAGANKEIAVLTLTASAVPAAGAFSEAEFERVGGATGDFSTCIDGFGGAAACADPAPGPLPVVFNMNVTAAPTNTPVPPTPTNTPVPALGMVKVPNAANLWVCKTGLGCTGADGYGAMDVQEQLFNGSTTGIGAYEFVVNYQNVVLNVTVGDGDGTCVQPPLGTELCPNPLSTPVPNVASAAGIPWHSFLGSTGRGPACQSHEFENSTTYGCVSLGSGIDGNGIPTPYGPKGDSGPATTGQCSPNPNTAPLSAAGLINPLAPPIPPFSLFNCPALATIHVAPDATVFQQIWPTINNGIVTQLLDTGCEVSDQFGVPLPGSVTGGLTPSCGSSTLTVRMLEGDINLDCSVDIQDVAGEAFRYGATTGIQLYNSFFDLQPNIHDGDIDIKDVQFIAGRFGSSCSGPIPPQPASSPIPDP